MKGLLVAVALLSACELSGLADVPKSVLPAFGNDGTEFTVKAKDGHTVQGWLPKDWIDNTDWAAVNATYTKLTDSPDKDAGAVRIKIEKVDEGQLQMTTYQGLQKFKKGVKYVVTGWVRSPGSLSITVGARQKMEPYEFYFEKELAAGAAWKPFEFTFTPAMELDAFLMFVVKDTGAVDLAGVAVEEKP
ncbi:MAG: carbohydrate binding domain-containing protein [Chthoniobacter sp.]|uniref:carbohydrate binding domain-containing protein n=1 Tax=Chthoniobacter sp. TaxID=2510640 RepID=UPI0032ABDBFB